MSHSLVPLPRHTGSNIEGISCAIFMYETGVLQYKVSLRSDESVNVAEVAAYFGGGGHARAAGWLFNMQRQIIDTIVKISVHDTSRCPCMTAAAEISRHLRHMCVPVCQYHARHDGKGSKADFLRV